MDEKRKFKVGDLVDAQHWDDDVHYEDGVIARVLDPGDDDYFSKKFAYYVVHACNPERGDFFTEERVKLRSADDAWRVGHHYLNDIVRADDGITSLEGLIEKFVADGDRPYKVTDRTAKESAFFGDAHLTLKHRIRDSRKERLRLDDWVVADDGNVRFEDAVIGPRPSVTSPGRRPREHFVYAADGSGDIRLFWEEHLRPRENPVPQELRDPAGRLPDYEWVHNAPERARRKAAMESFRQSAEAEAEVLPKDSSLYKHLYPEQPQRPIVSGFRGVLMWIAAIPVATLTAESLAPGAGQVVSLILVISSLGVVPWIAQRLNP